MKSFGIMQPYFLPYLGYFALMRQVGFFLVLDSVQYTNRTWINRNRIPRNPGGSPDDWMYLTIPVKKTPQSTLIKDIEISYNDDWQKQMFRTIHHLYARAPYFHKVLELLEPLMQRTTHLASLNEDLLKRFLEYLGIERPQFLRASEIVGADQLAKGQEKIVNLCTMLEAQEYWNLPGGKDLYSPSVFAENGIALRFVPEVNPIHLSQHFPEANLFSIIDVAMNMSPTRISNVLDEWIVGKIS